jgi:hypothetical protein
VGSCNEQKNCPPERKASSAALKWWFHEDFTVWTTKIRVSSAKMEIEYHQKHWKLSPKDWKLSQGW